MGWFGRGRRGDAAGERSERGKTADAAADRADLTERLDAVASELAQGGFAQLIFNAQGEGLADIEDLLIAVGAPRAQDYYVRAIRIALSDRPGYRAFLGDWHDPAGAAVRDELQLLGVEYLTGAPGFAEETGAWRAQG